MIFPVFPLPMVKALIYNLKTRRNGGEKLFETDYTRILAAIFHITLGMRTIIV
jgi:hypothetical protein